MGGSTFRRMACGLLGGSGGVQGVGVRRRNFWWGEAPERTKGFAEPLMFSCYIVLPGLQRAEPWSSAGFGSARLSA
jgi:hypothetical protein